MEQKQKKSTITRRSFLKGGLGACVAVAGFPYVARSQQLKKMKITAGTIGYYQDLYTRASHISCRIDHRWWW